MIDGIPVTLLNGVGVVGVVVVFGWWLIRAYSEGRIITRREADAITKRAENAEAERAALIAQNGELMEMARLSQAMFRALHEGAERT